MTVRARLRVAHKTQKDFIDQLGPLNIEARYPSFKERLLKSLSPEKCNELISGIEKLQIWHINLIFFTNH
jgi:hypothetical protein